MVVNCDAMAVRDASSGYDLQAAQSAVPVGYKQTELGVIPEDWRIIALSSLTERGSRITYGVVKPGKNDPNGVLFIRGGDVYGGKILEDQLRRISEDISNEYKRTRLSGGELLISLVGYPGEVSLVPSHFAGANIARQVALVKLDADTKLSSEYICSFLRSTFGRKQLLKEALGSAQQVINLKDVSKVEVILPSNIVEQRAIASALNDVETLLEGLDRLIAKKRDLKQAAMQQLLTGQTRLPGFEGEWTTEELGNVTSQCTSGATPYRGRPEFYKGKVKWISSGELNYCEIFDTNEHISNEAVIKTNLKVHPAGTFLIAITGLEAAGTRGACGIVGSPATTNQSCMAIYPTDRLQTKYLYHYYVYRGDELAFKYCQGTKQQSYTAKLVKKLPIDLPPTVKEQNAIATALSDMDAEIGALEQRRVKTAALKQAMMQELLTGRTRLIQPEKADV